MSKEISQVKKAEIGHQLFLEFQKARKMEKFGCLIQGKVIHQYRKYWSSYAPHCKNFDDFLVNELKIPRSTARHYEKVWLMFGEYVLSHELDIPVRRLIKLLPVAKENKEEWLLKAKELPERAFEDEIREAQGKLPSDKCEHPEEQRMYFYQCKLCKKWVKINNLNYQ